MNNLTPMKNRHWVKGSPTWMPSNGEAKGLIYIYIYILKK